MTAAVPELLSTQDPDVVLADLYDALGLLFGYPLALQPGEPIPAALDVVVSWFINDIWNPIIVPALQAPFLDYASGDWLGNTAFGTYNRPRITSEAATGPMVIENRTGGYVAPQAAGQVRIKSSVTGATYVNTTTITFATAAPPAYPYPYGSAIFEADAEGTASNANPGDIAAYPTALVAGPINCFAQTNVGPMLGSDGEIDPLLVSRCKLAPSELSVVSPPDAYTSVCLDPLGAFSRRGITPPSTWGTAAPAITRVGVSEPGNSTIAISLASASGPAAGNSSTADTDVYKAFLACQLVLPPGFTLTVAAATQHTIALGTVTIYLDRNARIDPAVAVATATLAINIFFSTLAIGGARIVAGGQGYVFATKVDAVLSAGPGVVDVGMTFSDVALAATEVAVPTYTLQAQLVTQ